jgi:hypothetical protein
MLEPDAEAYYGSPDNGSLVDPDGNPLDRPGETIRPDEVIIDPPLVEGDGKAPVDLMPQPDRPNQ